MKEVKAPSHYIKEKMAKMNLTPMELSKRMGISKQHLNHILNKGYRITPKNAIRLEIAFPSTSASDWIEKQQLYDMYIFKQN